MVRSQTPDRQPPNNRVTPLLCPHADSQAGRRWGDTICDVDILGRGSGPTGRGQDGRRPTWTWVSHEPGLHGRPSPSAPSGSAGALGLLLGLQGLPGLGMGSAGRRVSGSSRVARVPHTAAQAGWAVALWHGYSEHGLSGSCSNPEASAWCHLPLSGMDTAGGKRPLPVHRPGGESGKASCRTSTEDMAQRCGPPGCT